MGIEDITLPPPETAGGEGAGPVTVETPKKPGPTALDKYNAVAGAVSDSMQKGLSYANARRARETYKY
jgi:hypothetical protein